MEIGTDLSTLTPERLQRFGGLTGIYDLSISADEVAIRMYATGQADFSGGWSSSQYFLYSCFQLTGKIGKDPDVKIIGDDCDSPLVETALQGTAWVYVPFKELGTFPTQ